MVFIILGLSEESSQWSYVLRLSSQVVHNMHIVELCIVLGVKRQLIS